MAALAVLFIIIPFGICQNNSGQLTISSVGIAIDTAFKNNKEIKIQEKELNVARANVLGAKSEFLPQLNTDASYTHNATVLKIGSSVATSSKKDLGVITGYENDNNLSQYA